MGDQVCMIETEDGEDVNGGCQKREPLQWLITLAYSRASVARLGRWLVVKEYLLEVREELHGCRVKKQIDYSWLWWCHRGFYIG